MWSRVPSAALLFVVACSGNTLEPGAGNDPGTQTGAIQVGGGVAAEPLHPNASAPSEFTSNFTVHVSGRLGQVDDATVTVTSIAGKVQLTLHEERGFAFWIGSAPGYDEVYVLDVVTGDGKLLGARVDGPDIHVFSSPEEGATIDPTSPMLFSWDRSDPTNLAVMTIDSAVISYIHDTGEHSVPPELFSLADPDAVQHKVRLARGHSVGASGNSWGVTIANEIDVMSPTPNPQ